MSEGLVLDGWNVTIRKKSGMDTSLKAYNSQIFSHDISLLQPYLDVKSPAEWKALAHHYINSKTDYSCLNENILRYKELNPLLMQYLRFDQSKIYRKLIELL